MMTAVIAGWRRVVIVYNPATQFAAGGLGLWYDPSDLNAQFQESAGATPITATGQTVGKINDKSGRANHSTQITAPSRPIYNFASGVHYHAFDGLDDGLNTDAMTFSANMDCFIAIRRAAATTAVLLVAEANASSGNFFGVVQSGSAVAADQNSGTPTYTVNGVAINGGAVGTTRDQLHVALVVGSWVVLEVRNLNLSATWLRLSIGNYGSGANFNGDFGGMILAPAGDAATRTNNRKFLGNKVGLAL